MPVTKSISSLRNVIVLCFPYYAWVFPSYDSRATQNTE